MTSPVLQLCTYFDVHYLARGLALLDSIAQHWPSFQLWALCLDDETYEVLRRLNLPSLRPLPLSELLEADPDLKAHRNDRSPLAFYYTCTPSLLLHVLAQEPRAGSVIYVDADLFFFAHPRPLLSEFATGSIFIHRHRPRGQWPHDGNGEFNVGLLACSRDEQGLACLQRWREQCLTSCDDRPVNSRWGDQQYLEQWPGRYSDLVISQKVGVGVAPWNLADYRVDLDDDGHITIDDERLIFFHFHGLTEIAEGLLGTRLDHYGARLSRIARRHIYRPYLESVSHAAALVRRHGGVPVTPFGSLTRADWIPEQRGVSPRPRGIGKLLLRLARGHLLLAPGTNLVDVIKARGRRRPLPERLRATEVQKTL